MVLNRYYQAIIKALDGIRTTQCDAIDRAAKRIATALMEDKIIYIFGCGHSHMLAEEGFYRAGGLAAVSPIFSQELMLHQSAVKSSRLEKTSGIAGPLLDSYGVQPGDVLICISTSGVNATPVEMAQAAREKGLHVIGITSAAYEKQPAHNPQGIHLYQTCDFWIDNHAPCGDAVLTLQGAIQPMGPISTITGAFIVNCILAQAAESLGRAGVQPPIYCSGNIPGGMEKNAALIQKYASRIRHLGE